MQGWDITEHLRFCNLTQLIKNLSSFKLLEQSNVIPITINFSSGQLRTVASTLISRYHCLTNLSWPCSAARWAGVLFIEFLASSLTWFRLISSSFKSSSTISWCPSLAAIWSGVFRSTLGVLQSFLETSTSGDLSSVSSKSVVREWRSWRLRVPRRCCRDVKMISSSYTYVS